MGLKETFEMVQWQERDFRAYSRELLRLRKMETKNIKVLLWIINKHVYLHIIISKI